MSERWADRRRLGRLGQRLATAFVVVALVSLAVLFVGTVVPHIIERQRDPHDGLSLLWLLLAAAVAVATAGVVSIGLALRLTRPVDGYIDAALRFAAGDRSARPSDLGPPELRDLALTLEAAADEVERYERERRQLTSDIAHELRTPLAALQAGLEELRDGLVPPDRATLGALHVQATRMGRIIDDLSGLAAAEAGELRLHRDEVDLTDVVALAAAACRGTLDGAGMSLALDLDPGVRVLADADRVHQIVTNLLTNAAQYCRPGDRVTVRVRGQDGKGVLVVSDTGPGFGVDDPAVVFDRGWRSPQGQRCEGSGLGLPIVRALAQAHGGAVTASTRPEGGAAITVHLPGAGHGQQRPAVASAGTATAP